MNELIEVDLKSIDPNPFREARFVPRKIDALKASIAAVGMWPGMIGRRHGNRYQIPFAHHRLEAARQLKMKTLPLILQDLTDEQMIAMLGRENLEDFNADLLILLETWKAAKNFRAHEHGKSEPIDIANLLGWTVKNEDGYVRLNNTARACHGAYQLITGGHMQPVDLEGLSVHAAQDLVERVLNRIEMIDKLGKKGGRPAKEIESSKRDVAGAARSVAKDYRAGNVAGKNIRSEIDHRAVKTATKKNKQSPLFAAFAKEVADSIHKMLVDDKAAEKLAEMEKALPLVSMEEDRLALRRIDFALAEHEVTTGKWRNRLTAKGEKVVPFNLLKQGGV